MPVYNRVCAHTSLLVVLLFYTNQIFSQTIKTKVEIIDLKERVINEEKKEFNTELEAIAWCQQILSEIWSGGFPLAKMEFTTRDSLNVEALIFRNEAVTISEIRLNEIEENWRPRLRRIFSQNEFSINEQNIGKLMRNALMLFENNGYPFAKIWLDSFNHNNGGVSALLRMDKGPYFTIKSIDINTEVKISSSFLMNYLNIKNGDPFNYKKVSEIEQAISSLPYIRLLGVPGISYSDEGFVRISLELENVQVSSFNGIIGIAPQSKKGGGTLLTGQFDFRLRNPFERGTSFDFEFEKFQENSQKLNTRFEYPFILASPIGIDANFSLLKIDSSYVNLNSKFGVSYFFSGNTSLSIYYNQFRAYPLSQGQEQNLGLMNIKTRNYGIQLQSEKYDYMPNPIMGFRINIDLNVGSKLNVIKEDEISTVASIKHTFDIFIPLANKLTVLLRSQSQLIFDTSFSQNQATWIGGLKSLRGVNEGELPVKDYIQQTIEFRYLVDKNSHAKIFYDLFNVSTVKNNLTQKSWHQGLGVGFSFKTGPGIFTINYALAKTRNTAFNLSGGKVHFGFVSYF